MFLLVTNCYIFCWLYYSITGRWSTKYIHMLSTLSVWGRYCNGIYTAIIFNTFCLIHLCLQNSFVLALLEPMGAAKSTFPTIKKVTGQLWSGKIKWLTQHRTCKQIIQFCKAAFRFPLFLFLCCPASSMAHQVKLLQPPSLHSSLEQYPSWPKIKPDNVIS